MREQARSFWLLVCVFVALPAAAQTTLTPAQTWVDLGVRTDGIAIGDVHPNPGEEIIVIAQGSSWEAEPPAVGSGRVYVFDADLNVLTIFQPSEPLRELMGLPLVEQLDTGDLEYLVGEMRSAAMGGRTYALRGTDSDESTAPWFLAPRAWSGLYNLGPSSGDLLAGNGREIVIPSWDGIVQIVQRDTAQPVATIDLLDLEVEHLYGHATVADLQGDGIQDVVVVGADTGRVFGLTPDGAGGFATPYYETPVLGSYAIGSGPAVGDIDGDGLPEIVVTLTSPGIVRAFDPSDDTDCEYFWNPPAGGDYFWTSPVIGDVDGDGTNEIIAQAQNGQLSVLSTTGVTTGGGCVEGTYEVVAHTVGSGDDAWFTPALADINGDGAPEVITATYSDLEIIDVTAAGATNVLYTATEQAATFYPSAAVMDLGGTTSLFLSGWVNGAVYRYDLPGPADESWPTVMGDNERTGYRATPLDPDTSCDTCAGGACIEQCGAGGACDCTNPACGCDLQCTGGGSCSPTCSSGGECDITCAAVNNCTPSCTNGSICDMSCTDLNNCKDAVCAEGSTCDFTCESANNCGLTCDASTCNVTCNSLNNCKDIVCSNGAQCSTTCSNANNCGVECLDGSECELSCTNANNCEFKACDGVENTCADGRIVCNRGC